MIETVNGDLLTAKGIIVHGCNSKGVMGSGVAKQIKEKWYGAYEKYLESLAYYKSLGVYAVGTKSFYYSGDVVIVNGITQESYGRSNKVYVDYTAIRKVFRTVNRAAQAIDITEVNFPLIGCGLANGDWGIVSKIIDEELSDSLTKRLWIHE